MLPADRYQLVPPPNIKPCLACGAHYAPDRQFVGFDTSGGRADAVQGAVETVEQQGGATVYRGRNPQREDVDPSAGATVHQEIDADGAATTTVVHPQLCSDCVRQAAELIDYESPVATELEREREESTNLRERILELEDQRQNTEAVLRDTLREAETYKRMIVDDNQAGGTQKRTRSKAGRA
jgi:hypothetical protein